MLTFKTVNSLFLNSIYLVFSYLEMQRRLILAKVFRSVWDETTHKISKVATSKSFFSSVYVIGLTFFDDFLFHVITEGQCFLYNSNVVAYFEISVLKEVRILFFISCRAERC